MTAIAPHLRRPILGAVAAAVATIALKTTAYFLTGSVGLFSDAAESLVNLLASVTALASLWYAARPVDAEHTYGHEKIVYFSSGLEGVLIAVAAVVTAIYAIGRMINPLPVESLEIGSVITLVAAAINLVVARWLLMVGRRHGSIILEADGQHLMTDVWTSVAVVVGLVLARVTRIDLLDPVIALLMAANILRTGVGLMLRAFDGLMDRALPPTEQASVRSVIEAQLSAGCAFHALRTRQAGSRRFVDFHLLVPGATAVRQAHAFADRIEDAIRAALPETEVTIHFEPIEEPSSWQDSELIAIEEHSPPVV